MKTELNNPTKVKIPFEILYGDKKCSPYYKLGIYIQSIFDTDKQIDVSKIWVNSKTELKIDELLLEYMVKIGKYTKAYAKRSLGMVKLQGGPAMDYNNSFNLEDDYIYLEEDCIRFDNI